MPFKTKEQYNTWRRKYRKKQAEEGKCIRCYRPIVEDNNSKTCVNCLDAVNISKYLRSNFNGDN
jgi:hypothetical protein